MAKSIQLIENISETEVPAINMKWPERYLSVIAGVKIGLSGVRHLFSHPLISIIKIGAGGYLLQRGLTGHCELYSLAGKTGPEPVNETIRTSVIINRPRMEVYDFWRKLDNLPLFMKHLKSVEPVDKDISRWTLKTPVDITDISWDAAITADKRGHIISWKSLPGSMINNKGDIRFTDGPSDETIIHVAINYQAPAGGFGASLAYILNPLFRKMVKDDIQNFKRYVEVGEVIEIS